MARGLPTVVVAGLAGDTGKTLVTLGIARALARRGVRVAPFKKGPDFIDAAWIGAAAGVPGRNLDTYLMAPASIFASIQRAGRSADLALIEGNRGVFDGADAAGTHSTAELAKLIGAPVVLVIDATKQTRTAAALVLGCRVLDPQVEIAGVILNRVGTARQEDVIRRAIEAGAGLPVLGAIPRLDEGPLPSRHLGLVCAGEHPRREAAIDGLADVAARCIDLDAIRAIAEGASVPGAIEPQPPRPVTRRVRVGVLRDAAFSFYYPENLEALEAAGADLWPISPLADRALPEIDALYAGGGFPEEHAAALSANEPLRTALRVALAAGMPAWAECGGLIYLSRSLVKDGREFPMVGALPVTVEQTARPQGHGYTAATVDRDNPFFPTGTRLLGHEFHYCRVIGAPGPSICALDRGAGLGGRDGLTAGNLVATWMHLHALGAPAWAPGFVQAALSTSTQGGRHGTAEGR